MYQILTWSLMYYRRTREKFWSSKVGKNSLSLFFAECQGLALGKELVCRVSKDDTRQTNFFLYFDLQTFYVVFLQYLVLHVKIWYIFRTVYYIYLIYFIYLNFFRKC